MSHHLKIVDLSLVLNSKTPIYPGDPTPNISIATTLKNEGYNLFNLQLGTQTGSHLDAPYHFNNDGKTVDTIDLNLCFGKGYVIDMSHKSSNEEISVEDLQPFSKQIDSCNIILIKTLWDKNLGSQVYFEHPYLSEAGAEYLLSKNIKTIAIDTINLDKTGGTTFPVHDLYAKADGLIAENLANFSGIDFENPTISLLPLKLEGCDGSPIRAVAIDL
ncbi:MAG: cyclase family protein [Paraglaciecola sp.]|uniref:cyclase family protein n=1 Tax=Paraglaciecola sp. TaxID=1920173 RepID=UPI00329A2BFA